MEWNEFLEKLMACTVENFKGTKEYEYQQQRRGQIDDMFTTNLIADEKSLVDEVLFELGVNADYKTQRLYQQGMRDCVWLLKNLGVLA